MAIDGVKIIDSDQGYDIYNEVVGRYRDGEHVAKIIKDILDAEKDYCQTDFFTEIYWTALAYSLWKIGHLTDDIRDKTLVHSAAEQPFEKCQIFSLNNI